MRRDTFLLVVGVLVFVMPFLGVPSGWKDIAQFVLGALVVVVALVCRIGRRRETRSRESVLHVEHDPHGSRDDGGVHAV